MPFDEGVRAIVLRTAALLLIVAFAACHENQPAARPDTPRLVAGVTMRDVTFRSDSLKRDMPYRVILPREIPSGKRLPVVYLLHGGGADYRQWSNDSDVSRFAERGLILVMPEGGSSYYTNAADRPDDRFEDYIVHDLIADVESRFPAASERRSRAIVGISMGGFGAIKNALHHPELYGFVAGLSSAIDVPSRPFSIKRVGQWRAHRAIFGPWKGEVRRNNDPFVLARAADPKPMPYLFLTCGDQEGLLPANRRFAELLAQRHFSFEYHTLHGGHDWNQWNPELDSVFASLLQHVER